MGCTKPRPRAGGPWRSGQRLWLLLMLELWFRMFVDRDLAPGDHLAAIAPALEGAAAQAAALPA